MLYLTVSVFTDPLSRINIKDNMAFIDTHKSYNYIITASICKYKVQIISAQKINVWRNVAYIEFFIRPVFYEVNIH